MRAAPQMLLGVAALVAAAGASVACGGDDGAGASPSNASGCFLTFNGQLAGFRSWKSYSFDSTAAGGAGQHVSGPRTEYVNDLPAHGATEFPVGTIIVKEVGASDPANHHLFAMIKRGCDFNANGAKGWEYMEIQEQSAGASILWRGVGPPAGENYGGDPNGCNSCHAACTDNDSVCSAYVRLSTL